MGIIDTALNGTTGRLSRAEATGAAIVKAFPERATAYGQKLAESVPTAIEGRVTSLVSEKYSQAMSSLPTPARALISGLLGATLGTTGVEDFNTLRNTVHTLVRTPFLKSYQFRVSISGAPADFDLYAKEISYGGFDVQVDEEQVGSLTYAWPTGDGSHRLSMTLRETPDHSVWNFVHSWMRIVVHNDGTVGVPAEYIRTAHIYNLSDDGTETLWNSFDVFPSQCGEISRSREAGDFMEVPVVFTAFHTADVGAAAVTTAGETSTAAPQGTTAGTAKSYTSTSTTAGKTA